MGPKTKILQELPEEEMKRLNKMLGSEDKNSSERLKKRIRNTWYLRLIRKIEELSKNLKIK